MKENNPSFKSIFERLTIHTKEYVQAQTKSVQLEVYEGITNLVSAGINAVIIAVMSLFVLFFVNIGVAHLIGEWLGKTSLGYLAVAGFYLLLLIVFLLANKRAKKTNRVKNAILKQVSKNHTNFEELLAEQKTVSLEKDTALEAIQLEVETLKVKVYGDESEEIEEEERSFFSRPLLMSVYDFALRRLIFKRKTGFSSKFRPLFTQLLVETTLFSEKKIKQFFQRSEKDN